ncbi:hypothetical protein [Bifidobacterium simiarum]|nr:hypothetical protein [Bifidobacterium simiarum]
MAGKRDDSPKADRKKMDLWFPIDDEPQTAKDSGADSDKNDQTTTQGTAQGQSQSEAQTGADQTTAQANGGTDKASDAAGSGDNASQPAIKPLAEGDVVNTQWDIPPITFPALVEKTGPKHTADGAGSAQPSAPAQTFGPVIPAEDVTNAGGSPAGTDASAGSDAEPDEEIGRTIASATPHDGGDDFVDTAVITPLNAGFMPKAGADAAAASAATATTASAAASAPAQAAAGANPADTNTDAPADSGNDINADQPESGVEQLAETIAESPEEVFGDAVHQPINSASTISMPAIGTPAAALAFPEAGPKTESATDKAAQATTAQATNTQPAESQPGDASPEATMAFNPLADDADANAGTQNEDAEATVAFNPNDVNAESAENAEADKSKDPANDPEATVAFSPEDVKAAQAAGEGTGTAADQKASIFPADMDPTANTFQLGQLPLALQQAADDEATVAMKPGDIAAAGATADANANANGKADANGASADDDLFSKLPIQPNDAERRERARNLSSIESLEPKPGEKDPLALVPPEEQEKKKPNRKPIIIAAIAAVVVIALAVAGVMFMRGRSNSNTGNTANTTDQAHQTAVTACLASVDDYDSAKKSLDSAVKGVKDQLAITSDQVADANTVTTLKKAVDAANKTEASKSCDDSLSTKELKSNTKDNAKLTSDMKNQALAVTTAAKSVTSSKDAKDKTTTDNAKQNLQTAVDNAQSLFESSRYNVADDQTRVQLQIALGNANTLLDQDDPDLTAVQNAISALSTASANVEASMQELQNQNANSTQSNDGTQDGTTTDNGSDTGTTNGGTTNNSGSTGSGNSGSTGSSNSNQNSGSSNNNSKPSTNNSSSSNNSNGGGSNSSGGESNNNNGTTDDSDGTTDDGSGTTNGQDPAIK